MRNYDPSKTPSENNRLTLADQVANGATAALYQGVEPSEVLVAKTIANASAVGAAILDAGAAGLAVLASDTQAEVLDAAGAAAADLSNTPAISADFAEQGQHFVFAGDSLSDITWSAAQGPIGPGNNWNQKLLDFISTDGRGTAVYTAVQGRKIADLISNYATEVYPYRPAAIGTGKKSFLFVWIGVNDIGVTSLATIKSSWDSYVTTARADGFTVTAFTITSKSSFTATNLADVDSFNSYIRNSNNWDLPVDTGQSFPNPLDTTFFYDGIHLNAAGHLWLARHVNSVIYSRFTPVLRTDLVVPGSIRSQNLLSTANATGTATGRSTIEADAVSGPSIGIRRNGSGTDAKLWVIDGTTINHLTIGGVNDARSASSSPAIDITRSGNVITRVDIKGTNTNDSGLAGYVGEVISSVIASGSAVALTDNTVANVTSITLTAGEWEITGVVDYTLTGATTTAFLSGAGGNSATVPPQDLYVTAPWILTTVTDSLGQVIPTIRTQISSGTTVFLVARAKFLAGTVSAFGTIKARRVR